MPYWNLYLQSMGFQAQAIGELNAIIGLSRVIAPTFWGSLADRTGQHRKLVQLNSLLAALCFAGLLIQQSYLWIAIVMGLFSFFWSAALTLFETVTLAHLESQPHRYTHLRLWGSLGFIFTVILFGGLFQYVDISLLPLLTVGLFINIWLATLLVPTAPVATTTSARLPFKQVLQQPTVIALLTVGFLMQTSHGPYYNFYTIYLEQHGYSSFYIGQLWALGVIAEIGIFLVLHRLLKRFNLRDLLILSLALSSIRWLMIGYGVEWWIVLLLAQLLHAASFGMYHGVAIQLIRQYFTTHHQGRGQALYSSIGFGAGSVVGSLLSGYTWDTLGATLSYWVAAIICVIAIMISWRWVVKD